MLLTSSNNYSSGEISKNYADSGFMIFAAWLQKTCGMVIKTERKYLAQSKLKLQLEQYGNFYNLTQALKDNPHSTIAAQIIEIMTTNETMWFRDAYPFTVLNELIFPQMKAGMPRIWSAASSSGQEAYSIAITAAEYARLNGTNFAAQIVATDISRQVLTQAKSGIYSDLELKRGLNANYLQRYFVPEIASKKWQIKPNLKQMVEFRYFNLLDNFGALGLFDVIFCRNVLIYFDQNTKKNILQKLYLSLKKGGFLILGASESLAEASLMAKFKLIECKPHLIYQAI